MNNMENNFQFKDFIFLNTGFLESFVAQKYKGFPKEMQATQIREDAVEEIGEKTNSESDLSGKGGVGPFGLEKNKKTITEGLQVNQNNTETAQNVVIKVQKDNMYGGFLEFITKNHLLTNVTCPEIGKYVKLNELFYYIDFDRIQKLCSEDYQAIYSEYTDNAVEFSSERFCEIRNKVSLLKELIPFDALLYGGDYIVPIDQNWLRTEKEHLGYLMGGKISVVGKVCKALQINNEGPEVIKILNKIQEYTLSLLKDLGFYVLDTVYLVSPIAIYH